VIRSANDHQLAGLSRFCRSRLIWPDDDDGRLSFLSDLCERGGVHGWTLFPTADATAAFVARRHVEIGRMFRLTTPDWSSYRWAYDKRLTNDLAVALNVPHPRMVKAHTREEAAEFAGEFPVVLKPATKPRLNLPRTKAWLARDANELISRYDEAAQVVEPGALIIQEFIPGAGGQFSVAALCQNGQPLVIAVAERVRQYPMDFGRSSTYVETIENSEIETLSRRIFAELQLDGLAEIEFKRDPRDGLCKLLDINIRLWGWHTIGSDAGIDFTYFAWQLANGRPPPPLRARPGLRWLRLTTDLPVACSEMRHGRMSISRYLRKLLLPHACAVAALDDPFPGILEVPVFALSSLRSLRQ
jgi:predicted ATP-grasp superfamily ATP-dependent carboligase